MFFLSEARLEFYLDSFNSLLEELGEVDQRDNDALRIDFDAIWHTLHTASRMELGLLLARLAANHPVNQVWAPDDLHLLQVSLEERLHTVEWLDEVRAAPNPLLVNYIHSVLLDQVMGTVQVRPIQLTPEHIAGQLRVLMETPPDNLTKTLEAMETMHRSRVWLESMTPTKMLIFKTTPQEVALAIEQLEIAQGITGQFLDTEFTIPDQELAARLQAEENARQSNTANPDQDVRSVASKQPTAMQRPPLTSPEKRPVGGPRFGQVSKTSEIPHQSACNCSICTSPKLHPSQWTVMTTACGCFICASFQLFPRIQSVTKRLRSWGFPAHITAADCDAVRAVQRGASVWTERDYFWQEISLQESGSLLRMAFVALIDVPDPDSECFYKIWLSQKLNTMTGTFSEGAMLVALLWACVENAKDRDCFVIDAHSWLRNYHTYFQFLRDKEGY